MLRRPLITLMLALIAAAPAAAQMSGMKDHDPDKKAGGGKLPSGWMGRTDKSTAKLEDAKFATMGSGYHVTSGPAAIYWKESINAKVPFTASATFTQTKAPMHPEAYGIFYMGSKLNGPDQSYAYLLVRGDGKFMVKHRAGAEIHTITDWTESAAVHKADADGKATNTLSVDAKPDSTRLQINGVQVAAIGGAYANANGHVGLRVNHNLDVHIADFTVSSKNGTMGMASPAKKTMKKSKKSG